MQRLLAVFVLALVVLPAVGGPGPAAIVTEREAKQLALVHELEIMGLATNAASLIRQGRTERALQLLEQRMSSSFVSADRLLVAGIRLQPGRSLSLRKSPSRAVDYAVHYGRDFLAAPARSVAAKINQ